MTDSEKLYAKALDIAVRAHQGQTDRAGMPYILHPVRVASRCRSLDEKTVALLHDTIEDTDITAEYLASEGFPPYIVEAVLSVSRIPDESYDDFVLRSMANPIGREVKIHDLEDNMDITRLQEVTPKDIGRLNKYLKAYRQLTGQWKGR